MEINPFKTKINFIEYLEYVKPETKHISNSTSHKYFEFIKNITTIYHSEQYIIRGYHLENINGSIICVLQIFNSDKVIFIEADLILVNVEVVLKSELKNIKSVEQLNLF